MSTVTTKLGLTKPAGIEQFNLATYNNNLDILDNYVVNTVEKLPKNLVANLADDTSNAGYGSTGAIGSIVAVTLVKDRWYEARYRFTIVSGDNGPTINYAFNKSVTTDSTTAGTSLNDGSQRYFTAAAVANNSLTVEIKTKFKATANETVNIKVVLARAIGANTFAINSRVLEVFDLGANI